MNTAEAMRLMTNQNILGHRDVRAQVDFLIDGANAQLLRVLRRSYLDGFAFQFNGAFIGMFYAGQDFDQGRFARAVLSHERMNFPFSQGKINAFQERRRPERTW